MKLSSLLFFFCMLLHEISGYLHEYSCCQYSCQEDVNHKALDAINKHLSKMFLFSIVIITFSVHAVISSLFTDNCSLSGTNLKFSRFSRFGGY